MTVFAYWEKANPDQQIELGRGESEQSYWRDWSKSQNTADTADK